MRIFGLYITTAKKAMAKAKTEKTRRDRDNALISKLLTENLMLQGSAEYLLHVTKRKSKGRPCFAAGMDIAKNSRGGRQLSGVG